MTSRIIVRAELTLAAKKTLDELVDKRGMTQTAFFSRMVEWLTHQPPKLHASILGQVPAEISVDTAKLILQPAASGKRE